MYIFNSVVEHIFILLIYDFLLQLILICFKLKLIGNCMGFVAQIEKTIYPCLRFDFPSLDIACIQIYILLKISQSNYELAWFII